MTNHFKSLTTFLRTNKEEINYPQNTIKYFSCTFNGVQLKMKHCLWTKIEQNVNFKILSNRKETLYHNFTFAKKQINTFWDNKKCVSQIKKMTDFPLFVICSFSHVSTTFLGEKL